MARAAPLLRLALALALWSAAGAARAAGEVASGAPAPAEPPLDPEPREPELLLLVPLEPAPPSPDAGAPTARPASPSAAAPARRDEGDTWLDAGHALVGSLLHTVLQLDRFFSDERELEPERDRSFIRWRNEFRTDGRRPFAYLTTLRAEIRVPGLNRWLDRARLVIEGVSDATNPAVSEAGPGPTTGTPSPNLLGAVGRAAAEAQLALYENFRVKADVGAGILLDLPLAGIAQARLRYAQPFGDVLLLRTALTGFYRTDLRLGSSAALDLEKQLARATLLRLRNGGTISQRDAWKGIQWGTELALIQGITPLSAVSIGGDALGETRPVSRVDRYRVFTRYRRDFFRSWLFVELEPELAWPWDPVRGRERVLGFTFRLEAQFQQSAPGTERTPPRAPAPAGLEPQDPR